MKNFYIVFESGVYDDEWWYLDTFEEYKTAEDYANSLAEDSEETIFKVVEYEPIICVQEVRWI